MFVEDKKREAQHLDNAWAFNSDPVKHIDFRVTKMAVMNIINSLDSYKNIMLEATAQRAKIIDTDNVIVKDVDNG